MDEEFILQPPIDRRLENVNVHDLPPGPPGVEVEAADYDSQKKESVKKSHRRRSNSSKSPSPRKRRSVSRRRRSPSPRHSRYRESPSRRRRYGDDSWYRSSKRVRERDLSRERERKRSRDRERGRRSPSPRERSSYRDSRRSRSYSPRRNGSNSAKIPPAPPVPIITPPTLQAPPAPTTTTQYGIMPPPPLYGDNYAASGIYNQYNIPPPSQPGFVQQPQFNANYAPPWNGAGGYVQQQWMPPAPQPPVVAPPAPIISSVAEIPPTNVVTTPQPTKTTSKDDAVAMEAENHRGELKKQRVGYQRKMRELVSELYETREKYTKSRNEENIKMQQQLERKIGAIENVIDMLTNIIGDREEFETTHGHERLGINNSFNTSTSINKQERPRDVLERFKQALRATMNVDGGDEKNLKDALDWFDSDSSESSSSSNSSSSSSSTSSSEGNKRRRHDDSDDESSSERLKTKAMESMLSKKAAASAAADAAAAARNASSRTAVGARCNFTFYDPETHWCRTCNVFPKTARDFLNHLHSTEHIQREVIETPWHEVVPQDDFPVYENVETKRVPIRGVMFFSPASSWFCKLCKLWMGDLHCASVHLKSQVHFKTYNEYCAKNPNFEIEWDAQRLIKRHEMLATAPSTTIMPVENDNTISSSKAYAAEKPVTCIDSSDSSSDSDSSGHGIKFPQLSSKVVKTFKRKKIEPEDDLEADSTVAPPPPPKISGFKSSDNFVSNKFDDETDKRFKKITKPLPPIISESEKKLLEQLKGKMKQTDESEISVTKPRERSKSRELDRDKLRRQSRSRERRRSRTRSRSLSRGRNRGSTNLRARGRRSISRGRRSISRRRRSISRGRGGGWNRRRGNFRRSRSLRRRSRTTERRRRSSRTRSRSRSYSRSRSVSPVRVEKPIVKHSEFRPRVQPEADKKKKESRDKLEAIKKSNTKQSNGNGANKKLPIIGKMPVLSKKQSTAQETPGVVEKNVENSQSAAFSFNSAVGLRPQAPTAAQIQMAMMEDVYGNAPPFHPDAGIGMDMDYDDLMPDPVQFVNLMGNVPPPPPPKGGHKAMEDDAGSDSDMLPPGIDPIEEEEEQVVIATKSQTETNVDADKEDKNDLPKDLEEALNIIFPGEKKLEDDTEPKKQDSTETRIIVEESVMQAEDLAKEGIHIVTSADIDAIAMDDASQMSMNEPLIFKTRNNTEIKLNENIKNVSASVTDATTHIIPIPGDIPMPTETHCKGHDDATSAAIVYDLDDIPPPPASPTESEKHRRQEALDDLALLGIDADDLAAQCI